MRKLAAGLIVVSALGLSLPGCSSAAGGTYHADFRRAIQVFTGVKVRVLGVTVGQVIDVTNVKGAAEVTFQVTDSSTKLPADVKAAVVPMSLLGERYIQLFPAYQGGPALPPGATIPLSRTAVPAEPDELLSSLNRYLSGLKSSTVSGFVRNTASILNGNGGRLNDLIHHAASVLETLASKKDALAEIIVELNKLTVALSTRQQRLGSLIRNYNAVVGTLTHNRSALEGTIKGLSLAATQLASLLVAHRAPLHQDIRVLTRTSETLLRNVGRLAQTGQFAVKLFHDAARAADYKRDWLRLNNQGQEIGPLIFKRLEQRLMELCRQSGFPKCSTSAYWQHGAPALFCAVGTCPGLPQPSLPAGPPVGTGPVTGGGGKGTKPAASPGTAAAALASAIRGVPGLERVLAGRAASQGSTLSGAISEFVRGAAAQARGQR